MEFIPETFNALQNEIMTYNDMKVQHGSVDAIKMYPQISLTIKHVQKFVHDRYAISHYMKRIFNLMQTFYRYIDDNETRDRVIRCLQIIIAAIDLDVKEDKTTSVPIITKSILPPSPSDITSIINVLTSPGMMESAVPEFLDIQKTVNVNLIYVIMRYHLSVNWNGVTYTSIEAALEAYKKELKSTNGMVEVVNATSFTDPFKNGKMHIQPSTRNHDMSIYETAYLGLHEGLQHMRVADHLNAAMFSVENTRFSYTIPPMTDFCLHLLNGRLVLLMAQLMNTVNPIRTFMNSLYDNIYIRDYLLDHSITSALFEKICDIANRQLLDSE